MMMRSALITVASLALTSTVIGNAYFTKKQFYPSVVYITKSNPSMAIIYLQAFVFVLLMGKLMRKIFFGQLRAAEMEHLIERSWYAVTETCLAFTVFRDDLSPKFVALFTLLLFLKCFHWLAEDRVDYMERSPNISLLFHFRVACLLALLGTLDLLFVNMAYHSTLTKGASVQLVFGFEYAILFTIVMNIFSKYILHCIDLQSENPWDDKAVYLLYSELGLGLMKVVLYLTFITIMMKIHTFPLFAIRPMYLSMRAFKKALNDVIMSRRAINNMNTMYPNATAEELDSSDNVCIICREEMVANGSAKKLPCNHIFHVACLRSWFQRQQTCPTCRMDVLRATPAAGGAGPAGAAAAAAQAAAAAAGQAGRGPGGLPQAGRPGQPQIIIPGQWNQIPFVNFMAFPPWQQMAGVAPHPPGQPAAGAAGGPENRNGPIPTVPPGTTAGNAQAGPQQPHMVPPMFGFPPPPPFGMIPFPSPMPPPPVDLGRLSLEELGRMEGTERENIEARIRCLRNIQTMLDAAVLQLQMYNSTVERAGLSRSSGTATTAGGGVSSSTTETAHPSTSSSSSSSAGPSTRPTGPVTHQAGPSTSAGTAAAATSSSATVSSSTSSSSSSSAPAGDSSSLDAETLRKRRLERLSQVNPPTLTASGSLAASGSGSGSGIAATGDRQQQQQQRHSETNGTSADEGSTTAKPPR